MSNRLTISSFLLTVLAGLYSCGSLLDVEASNNISGDIYKTEEGIQKALTGAYYNLGGIYDGSDGGELLGGDFMLIPSLLMVENVFEMNWDNSNGPTYSNFVDREILATNVRVESNWRRAYETINTLNSILLNIDNISNASEKSRIEGEALAMRGLLYFEMVRLWGPEYASSTVSADAIPLILEPVDVPGRSPDLNTVSEIYDQVEEDLTAASSLLQSLGKNDVNLSYYACQAYLMRLAMHKADELSDYDEVIAYANNIIASSEFELTDSPLEAFNNLSNSSEDVFAIQQTSANNSGDISTGTGLANYHSSLSGQGLGAFRVRSFYVSNTVFEYQNNPDFSDSDLRGTVDSEIDGTSSITDVNTAFYKNVLNSDVLSLSKFMAGDHVIPIIRLAEIYLTRAEALSFRDLPVLNTTALDDYNEVRTRAGLSELMPSDFSFGLALYDSILLEQKREFLYEGHLLHNARRRGESLSGNVVTGSEFLLPIPQSELDAR